MHRWFRGLFCWFAFLLASSILPIYTLPRSIVYVWAQVWQGSYTHTDQEISTREESQNSLPITTLSF